MPILIKEASGIWNASQLSNPGSFDSSKVPKLMRTARTNLTMLAVDTLLKHSQQQKLRVGLIGLELASDALRLMQLQLLPESQAIIQACSQERFSESRDEIIESPKRLKSIVKSALKKGNFCGRSVVATLSQSDVRIMSVTYHANREINDDASLAKVMSNRLEGDLMDYVIDYMPVRAQARDGEQLAVVAVAKKQRVIQFLETMRLAGLKVKHLEIGPSAIKRMVGALSEAGQYDNVLVMHFGEFNSFLSMVSGRRLLFDHKIDFGESAVLTEIAQSLEVSSEHARELVSIYGLISREDDTLDTQFIKGSEISSTLQEIIKPQIIQLVEETNRSLIYAASETRGKPVQRIYVLGSMARWSGLLGIISGLVNIPVVVLDPLEAFKDRPSKTTHENHPCDGRHMVIAAGLALRGLEDHGGN